MCDCKVGWVVDESVAGSHNSKPITCREYIAALEAAVEDLSKTSADNGVLAGIQKACGVKK